MSESQINNGAYAGRSSVCWNCGALVGATETECSACGAPKAERNAAPAATANAELHAPDPETLRFARAVLSRPATLTFLSLIANLFVFLLMQLYGGSENYAVLAAFGAKYNSLINEGQWWRFVTPVFMHIGWIHLLVNMYSLFMLGPYVEKLYGSAKFVVFWILTGIAGVAASYFASMHQMNDNVIGRFLFRGGDGPSAGASGALFGLVGVLFVFGIKFRHELPEGFKRAFGTGMLPTILINLYIGYSIPFIDNAAHLGGFFAGIILALFVSYKRPGARQPVAYVWHGLQVAVLLTVLVGFGLVWQNFAGPQLDFDEAGERLLSGGAPDPASYLNAINQGEDAFRKTLGGDREIALVAVQRLQQTAGLNEEADRLRLELAQLLVRARDLVVAEPPQTREADRAQEQQVKQLAVDYKQWEQSYKKWVETEGGDSGIELRPVETPQPKGSPAS